jgi:hypothetical protein
MSAKMDVNQAKADAKQEKMLGEMNARMEANTKK